MFLAVGKNREECSDRERIMPPLKTLSIHLKSGLTRFCTIYTRPVQMLLCGLLLLTLAIAVLNTLVPLWLAQLNPRRLITQPASNVPARLPVK
jgi:hypothetical protein